MLSAFWDGGRNRDQFSVTQKHLNTAQRLAYSVEGKDREEQEGPTVKNLLASDSVEKTTQSPWFHSMWAAREKASALSLVGWSMESLMKRIFKCI